MSIPSDHKSSFSMLGSLNGVEEQPTEISPHEFVDSSQVSTDFSIDALKTLESSPAAQPQNKRKSRAWGISGGFGKVLYTNGSRKLQCTIEGCGRIFSSKNSSTSTFNNHLVSFHGIKRPTTNAPTDKIFGVTVPRLPAVDPKNYPKHFENSVQRYFLMNALPVASVESEEFRQMIACAYLAPSADSLTLPTAQELQNMALSGHHHYFPRVRELLQSQGAVALSLALRNDILGVVAHFIDPDWCYHSLVIGMEPVKFGDATSALLKVTNLMGITSTISSIVKEPSLEIKLPNLIPCFSRVATLACQAAIRNYEEKAQVNLLHRVRMTIKSFKNSPNYAVYKAQFKDKPVCDLLLDHPSQWDSTFLMLERVVLVYPSFNIALASQDQCFSDEESKGILRLASFLKLFDEFSKAISGEKTLTLAMALYYYGSLANNLKPHPEDPGYISSIKQAALSELIRHFSQAESPILTCSMAMDPRHKLLPESPVWSIANIDNSHNAVTQEWNQNYKVPLKSEPEPPRSIFEFSNAQFVQPADEFESYLAAPVLPCKDANSNLEILKYWCAQERLHPNLSRMAKKYLAIPISATFAEVLIKESSPISESKLERTLLKSWLSYFDSNCPSLPDRRSHTP